jgi:hypothetical protein
VQLLHFLVGLWSGRWAWTSRLHDMPALYMQHPLVSRTVHSSIVTSPQPAPKLTAALTQQNTVYILHAAPPKPPVKHPPPSRIQSPVQALRRPVDALRSVVPASDDADSHC